MQLFAQNQGNDDHKVPGVIYVYDVTNKKYLYVIGPSQSEGAMETWGAHFAVYGGTIFVPRGTKTQGIDVFTFDAKRGFWSRSGTLPSDGTALVARPVGADMLFTTETAASKAGYIDAYQFSVDIWGVRGKSPPHETVSFVSRAPGGQCIVTASGHSLAVQNYNMKLQRFTDYVKYTATGNVHGISFFTNGIWNRGYIYAVVDGALVVYMMDDLIKPVIG